jgi:hypothetical protein
LSVGEWDEIVRFSRQLSYSHLFKRKERGLMERQTTCSDTTKNIIQNTSQPQSDTTQSDQPTNNEQTHSEQRTDRGAGKSSQSFTLLDLCRLTFTLDGVDILNVQDATNEQFAALADVIADVTNVEQWYLEERRDFINGLHVFCEERSYPFPFTLVDEEKTPTAKLPSEEEQDNVE